MQTLYYNVPELQLTGHTQPVSWQNLPEITH